MIALAIFALGLCIGSFIGAFTWRLHQKKDWVKSRSVCEHCGHTLKPIDLIPVISWLSLKGKCRYCNNPIGTLPIILELTSGSLFVLSYANWPYGIHTETAVLLLIVWLVIMTGLIALAVYDIKWMELPDKIVYPLTIIGCMWPVLLSIAQRSLRVGLVSLVSGVILFGVFYFLFQLSNGKWIGGGDVKVSFLLGILAATPLNSFLLIFIASILGTVAIVPSIITSKLSLRQKVPFGPFLIAATIIVVLFGAQLVTWYEQQILLL